ncbi:MAG TPA: hypothetical protein ACQGQI_05215 [Xylella sp.]
MSLLRGEGGGDGRGRQRDSDFRPQRGAVRVTHIDHRANAGVDFLDRVGGFRLCRRVVDRVEQIAPVEALLLLAVVMHGVNVGHHALRTIGQHQAGHGRQCAVDGPGDRIALVETMGPHSDLKSAGLTPDLPDAHALRAIVALLLPIAVTGHDRCHPVIRSGEHRKMNLARSQISLKLLRVRPALVYQDRAVPHRRLGGAMGVGGLREYGDQGLPDVCHVCH